MLLAYSTHVRVGGNVLAIGALIVALVAAWMWHRKADLSQIAVVVAAGFVLVGALLAIIYEYS